MTNEPSTQKQTWSRMQRGLALGLALSSLLVFSIPTQAQTSKLSTSKKSTFKKSMLGTTKVVSPSSSTSRRSIGKPSTGQRSSVSKKPSIVGSRVSRSSSIGISNSARTSQERKSSSNNQRGISRPGISNSDSNRVAPGKSASQRQVPDNNRGGTGFRDLFPRRGDGRTSAPRLEVELGQGVGRTTVPRPQPLQRVFPPSTSGSVRKLPVELPDRFPRKPIPNVGSVLPESNARSPSIKLGDLPRSTKNNRSFENILGRISTVKPKPNNLKDFGKDLSKLTLLNEDKPELRVKQQVRVLGARKTMMHRFGMGAGCHWWADLLCGWHMHRHGCNWTDLCAVPGYWSCWTRCHYRVVWCPTVHGHVRSAWYFGIESFLIPDVHALGVHEVSPYSPAAMAGLKPGDMILSVNGYAFDNDSVLPEMIQTSGGILDLEVYREGMESPMAVQVRLRRLRITSH